MTYNDDVTTVPMNELNRLRRVEAAGRALRDAHDWKSNSKAEELLLIALDLAFMTGEEMGQFVREPIGESWSAILNAGRAHSASCAP
jgi:hypothetical protein